MPETTDYPSEAERLFREGYSCSQSVFCAFAPALGLERDRAAALSSPFGGGIGRMREVCGAFSGLMLLCGFVVGYSDPADSDLKNRYYCFLRSLADDFRAEASSIVCREIMPGAEVGGYPAPRTEEFYRTRPCLKMVRLAARIGQERVLPLLGKSI
ncbi:MAG: C_GCAxxG_C_C family protein [Clostridia bacterium]|nr:C_GCAxxG_C_C family protein [Clostridia bacterium]